MLSDTKMLKIIQLRENREQTLANLFDQIQNPLKLKAKYEETVQEIELQQ